jgi:hypothetical protein
VGSQATGKASYRRVLGNNSPLVTSSASAKAVPELTSKTRCWVVSIFEGHSCIYHMRVGFLLVSTSQDPSPLDLLV